MKKYWKLIATTTIAIISIGTYMNSAISANQFPEFVIEKQSGDSSLVETVKIEGSYGQEQINKGLQITKAGTVYASGSALEGLTGNHQPMIGQLIEEHRDFMRGKAKYIRNFYEDKHSLVYADVTYQTAALSPKNFKFAISVLDKEEDESISYELPIPNASDLQNIRIVDVQKMNGKLKMITDNYAGDSEIHVYTIDMATKELIANKTILSSPKENKNGFSEILFVNENNPKQSHQYVVFKKRTMKEVEQSEGHSVHESVAMEVKDNQLIAYNLATNEKKNIILPQELDEAVSVQEEAASIQAFDGSFLYFMENNKNEVIITPYNLESEKIGNVIAIQFPSVGEHARHPVVKIKNGNLYTLSPFLEEKSAATLKVTDLKSRETLYKGQVVEENPNTDENKYELSWHRMTVE